MISSEDPEFGNYDKFSTEHFIFYFGDTLYYVVIEPEFAEMLSKAEVGRISLRDMPKINAIFEKHNLNFKLQKSEAGWHVYLISLTPLENLQMKVCPTGAVEVPRLSEIMLSTNTNEEVAIAQALIFINQSVDTIQKTLGAMVNRNDE